jgi:hypothetical protein
MAMGSVVVGERGETSAAFFAGNFLAGTGKNYDGVPEGKSHP